MHPLMMDLLPLVRQGYCCSQLLGQKNTTFTMYLALQYAGALVAMGPIFYILWHNTWNAYQMYQYDRRRNIRHAHDHQLE